MTDRSDRVGVKTKMMSYLQQVQSGSSKWSEVIIHHHHHCGVTRKLAQWTYDARLLIHFPRIRLVERAKRLTHCSFGYNAVTAKLVGRHVIWYIYSYPAQKGQNTCKRTFIQRFLHTNKFTVIVSRNNQQINKLF